MIMLSTFATSSNFKYLIDNKYFQIARELRLRDIGGIIVVDFIDMEDECKFNFPVSLGLSPYLHAVHTCIIFHISKVC